MKLYRHLSDMPFELLRGGSIVSIGSFDGLHRGHQQLVQQMIAQSRHDGMPTVVMSFEPTPKEFFQARKPPARLMRFREKCEALSAAGVDMFYCPRFSPAMRDIAAVDFVRRILVQGLNVRHLVVGDDFRFARHREGNFPLLQRLSQSLDFVLEKVPSVVIDGVRVSSTAIREACENGDMSRATLLLGKPYRMSGKIVRGEQVGRTLGFPTANVDLRRKQSPVMGVFAVRVHGLNDVVHDGVASVGTRPTFDGTKPLLEVFLFDFKASIYGQYIHVDFIAQLRDQVRYDRVEDLVAQMHRDVDDARKILRRHAA